MKICTAAEMRRLEQQAETFAKPPHILYICHIGKHRREHA